MRARALRVLPDGLFALARLAETRKVTIGSSPLEASLFALTATLMASVSFATPVTIGPAGSEHLDLRPDPGGGAWVSFASARGERLAKIREDGTIARVALPLKLRGEDLAAMPLPNGWTVVTNRYWPGGSREESRCSPIDHGGPEQTTNCGVLVVAQRSPAGRWTRVHLRTPG